MALIASRWSIMPKDLSGEPLQKAEVESCKDNDDLDDYDNDDHDDDDVNDNDDCNDDDVEDTDRLRSYWRQQIGLQLITGMNLGGDIWTKSLGLQMIFQRFAVVEGPEGISAYLDMLDAWYSEHRFPMMIIIIKFKCNMNAYDDHCCEIKM